MLFQNQFSLTTIQGAMDLRRSNNVVSAIIDITSAGGLVPGQAVKIVAQGKAGGILPHVVEASDGDLIFGFLVFNLKDQVYNALMQVEVSTGFDDVMYMTAAGALSPLTKLKPVIASKKVTACSPGDNISAYNLDQALADGDLIRCVVSCPSFFKA